MGASRLMSVVASCVLAGCGAGVQPGLANAPGLGGTSPETRVHDAIGNGHDACARAMFPQGGVLRGQVPPCAKEPRKTVASAPLPPRAAPSPSLSYPFGLCPPQSGRHNLGAEKDLTAFSLSPPRLWPACDPPENASPAEGGLLRLEWPPLQSGLPESTH